MICSISICDLHLFFCLPNVDSSENGSIGFVLYQNDKFFPSKNYKSHFDHTKQIISGQVANATVNDVKIAFRPQVSLLISRTEREDILENVT